jgi:hypothetical protein
MEPKNKLAMEQADSKADAQSGKLSVLTERSEENLTEYQRTIQSLQQQRALLQELEEYKQMNGMMEEEEHQHSAEEEGYDNGHAEHQQKGQPEQQKLYEQQANSKTEEAK